MKKYVFLFLTMLVIAAVKLIAQGSRATLDTAHEYYQMGRLPDCIAILQRSLAGEKGSSYTDKVDAYRLLVMAYLAKDSLYQADETIRSLILLKDNFEADTRDPARFKLRVLYMRQQLRANLISSVSKKAESIDLAPATIQIITAEDIVNRGYQDLEAIFSDLPGFDVSRTNGLSYSTLYQRGYRSSALTDRTLVLIDGVEDNELWTNAAYLSKQYPLSALKRVEIIYGPASTIYGANAFQGVINIVTKGEEDFFAQKGGLRDVKGAGTALNFHTGAGSYRTRYYDGTLAIKNDNIFFSLTGRIYRSDEFDLSHYANWDGKVQFDPDVYRAKLMNDSVMRASMKDPIYYYHTVKNNKVIPTDLAVRMADSLDKAAYSAGNSGANQYGNPTRDVYIGAKLHIGDVKLGFQYWNIKEGTASDYLDNYVAVNSLTNWQVKQYFLSVSYNKILFRKIYVSWFSYFKSSQFGPRASTTRYLSYGNGDLSLFDLIDKKLPSLLSTYYSEQTNQFRTELRTNYNINQFWDVMAGTEFRNGIMQGDYVKGALYPAVEFGTVRDSLSGSKSGGNNYAPVTFGLFAQLNYQNKAHHLNINAGGRFDYNRYRIYHGYGSVFNPRLAVIYYPGNFVFKSIYSEAFLDASGFNKFSTSATRLSSNPSLKPEKVKNIEFGALYKYNKSHVEIALYSARYNSILQSASAILQDGRTTTQFQALGAVYIRGLQASWLTSLNKHVDVYANFSLTDPSYLHKADGALVKADTVERLGDISKFTLNAGVNITLLKSRLVFHVRTNVVGDKPTGKGTSVDTNPLRRIRGYRLLNSAITYRITEPVQLQLAVNNVLNQAYASPGIRAADDIQYAASVPQPARNYFLRLIVNLTR